MDEEVFEQWRVTARRALSLAREHAARGFSQPQAFKAAVLDAEREWKANIDHHRRGYLGTVLEESNAMYVAIVGATLGAALSGGSLAGPAIGALGGAALGIINRCVQQYERFSAEGAAITFFTAIKN
jgi:hypothetical protein